MHWLRFLAEQWDTFVRAVRLVRRIAHLRRQENEFLRTFEERRRTQLEPALRAVAEAYAKKEGLPPGSVKVILNREGALVAELEGGESRVLGYVDDARPN
jgi:hypothetical protein